MLGSYNYYIENEQAQAAEDMAPLNAIYKRESGEWCTADDIKSPERKQEIEQLVEELRER
jgi:hypothetical protein